MTFTARMYSNLGTRHSFEPASWRQEAACRDADPAIFFPEQGISFNDLLPEARRFCNPCPVRRECLTEAESFNGTWGIFAGKAFGTSTSVQRFSEVGELVECQGCGAELVNQKGGRVRKWCSMNCRERYLRRTA